MSHNVIELVNQIYPEPDPNVSDEQAERYSNRDLSSETIDTLRRELTTLHIINFAVDSEWHRDRETAVAFELGVRRARRRMERSA